MTEVGYRDDRGGQLRSKNFISDFISDFISGFISGFNFRFHLYSSNKIEMVSCYHTIKDTALVL